MKRADLLIPFLISAVIHLALFLPGASGTDATIVLDKGASAVALNFIPSVASSSPKPTTQESQPAHIEVEEWSEAVASRTPEPTPLPEPPAQETPPLNESPLPALTPKDLPAADVGYKDVGQEAAQRPPLELPAPPMSNLAGEEQMVAAKPDGNRPEGRSAAINSTDSEGDLGEKGVTAPAQIEGLTKPRYPSYSRRHGEEGTVVLSIEVLPNGKHGGIQLVRSSGYSRLDEAAIQATRQATFIPATANGDAIASEKRISFTFRLKDALQ